jgi:hypothetical protein
MVNHGRYGAGLLKNLSKKCPVRVINAKKHFKAIRNVLIGTVKEKNE